MSTDIWRNAGIYLARTDASYDLSGQANTVELARSFESKDRTTLRDPDTGQATTHRRYGAGLEDWSLSASGIIAYGERMSDAMSPSLTAASVVATVAPDVSDGADVNVGVGYVQSFESNAQVGDDPTWAAEVMPWRSRYGMQRGTIMHPPYTERAMSGNGTVRQLGAVVEGKRVHVYVTVLDISVGASLEVTVQSAPTLGFTAPIDRIELPAVDVRGERHDSIAGPISDPYWRVTWAVDGPDPTVRFIAVVAIA